MILFLIVGIVIIGCSSTTIEEVMEDNFNSVKILHTENLDDVTLVFFEDDQHIDQISLAYLKNTLSGWNLKGHSGYVDLLSQNKITWMYSYRNIDDLTLPLIYGTYENLSIDEITVSIDDITYEAGKLVKNNSHPLFFVLLEKRLEENNTVTIIAKKMVA